MRWSGFRSIVRLFAGILVALVLARLLTPNDFGLVAMAAVFTNITIFIVDFGTGEALIQHQKSDKTLESSVYWLNICVASSIAGLLFLSAPVIAELYGQPIVNPIVKCLSLVLVVQSASLVHVSLFKKHRNFKAIAYAEIVSQIGGASVAISLALNDFGVWSLVCYTITKASFYTIFILILSDWKPRFCYNSAKINLILSFSLNFTVVKFLNYIERNSDKLIIGYFQGPLALGLYSRAYTSFNQIIKLMNGFYNPVFYSILSRELNNKVYIKKLFLLSIQSLTFLFVPVSIILIVLSDKLVMIIFGLQWLEMAPILKVLGGVCIAKPIHKLNVEVFKSFNKVQTLRAIWIIFTPFFVISFFVGQSLNGIIGVAAGYLIVSIALTIVTTYFVMRHLSINITEIFNTVFNIGIRAIMVFFATLALNGWSASQWLGIYPSLSLLLQLIFILVLYLGLQFLFPVKAQIEILSLVRRKL